jgi:hypothetical protein
MGEMRCGATRNRHSPGIVRAERADCSRPALRLPARRQGKVALPTRRSLWATPFAPALYPITSVSHIKNASSGPSAESPVPLPILKQSRPSQRTCILFRNYPVTRRLVSGLGR